MAFAILGTAKPRFDDTSGSPLVSGTITTQNPSDSAVKASFPTAADADAGTNGTSGDITLDARGEPTTTQYWGKDGEDYKVIIKDSAAATVYTIDNIRMPTFSRRGTVTFTSTDATPTVAESELFLTNGTTAITDFDDGQVGDIIKVRASGNITITDGSAVSLQGQQDFNMATQDTLTLAMFVDQVWQEVSRSYEEETIRFKTADESLTNTTLADDTHLVGWTLQPATHFRLTGYLKTTSDGNTQDLKIALQTSQTFQEAHWSWVSNDEDGGTSPEADSGDPTSATTIDIVSGKVNGVQIMGFLLTHASATSTVDFQVAQGTDAGTTTLEKGSWFAIEVL